MTIIQRSQAWLQKIRDSKSPYKKIVGVVFIILGFLALVTPFTPGSWLIFVGLELVGLRITAWDWIKSKL
ncbi:MAG: hypothetical protein P4L74_03530 [Candidatus Doudnabacteria bacterium]|nr:hypothetical protein [Candidatus Doudnabacteria bacterium]